MKKQTLANLMLVLTAIFWGSGFIPQKIAATGGLSTPCYNGLRYMVGAIFIFFLAKCKLPFRDENGKITVLAGVVLSLAALLQQYGLETASIANASFITATYIVLVPFISAVVLRNQIPRRCYFCALLALVGLYFLSTAGKGLDHINTGDIIVFIGSLFWAMHILIVEKGVNGHDPVKFSAGQFLVAGVLQTVIWLIFDKGNSTGLSQHWPLVLYSGIVVLGLAFTLQAIGQKYTSESEASIILGLESVFGAVFGALIYHETMLPIQILGAALIFAAVIISVGKS